ncbi:MAG: hypothetical protein M3Q03_04705, partial [Chloroflexota bacterium]|nr:hypothetical protein [Chloroflexota bacterium]
MTDELTRDFVRQIAAGTLSRRRFLQQAVALGLSVPAISTVLTASAASAPGSAAPSWTGSFQADTSTLILADNMSSGGLWLSLDPAYFYEPNHSAAMNVVYETLYHIPDTTRPDYFEPLLADG